MQPRPRTIQIYLPKGDPRGIRVAELTTSIVRVTEVPRALLDQFQDMPEAKQVALDSDVQLTHYRLRKMGERTLDLSLATSSSSQASRRRVQALAGRMRRKSFGKSSSA